MTGSKLSDSELAMLLEGKADALKQGDRSREEIVREILELLGGEPGVVERSQVYDDGRTSFGRKHAGDGIALFMSDDSGGDAP